jgi:uncharacterized DUF497 family protein
MEFEWDEAKRRRVLEERGLDFLDATALFDGRQLLSALSKRGAEERWLSIGELDGRVIALVWTVRDRAIRFITMRRARNEEKRRYRTHVSQAGR